MKSKEKLLTATQGMPASEAATQANGTMSVTTRSAEDEVSQLISVVRREDLLERMVEA
jgi:ACT domain-containing protein